MRKANGQFEKGHHWREARPFREKDWLVENYIAQRRSTGEIAAEFGTTDAAILFWLRKHGIPRRTVSEARGIKHWGQSGADNPMWNKRGELNPRWLGGVTLIGKPSTPARNGKLPVRSFGSETRPRVAAVRCAGTIRPTCHSTSTTLFPLPTRNYAPSHRTLCCFVKPAISSCIHGRT